MSAAFESALGNVLRAEGPGGTAAAGDPGKLTVFGITITYEPNWPGWPLAHQLIAQGVPAASWWQHAELMGYVRAYYLGLWTAMGLEALSTPELQSAILGGVVNQGPKVIAWLQAVLGVLQDKLMGPTTLAAIKGWEQAGRGRWLALELDFKRMDYYARTAQIDDLRGLVLRITREGA